MFKRAWGLALIGLALLLCGNGHTQDKKSAKPTLSPRATPELVEGVLKSLEVSWKKEVEKEGVEVYSFLRGETKVTLKNYGDDLWIETLFDKKLTPAQANEWNSTAKYSRCVLLESETKTTTVLEMQLDCIKGVTDGMVRQFIVRFAAELKEFQKFVK